MTGPGVRAHDAPGVTRRRSEPRGLLGRRKGRPFLLERYEPSADLAWCVEHHWTVRWDVPAGEESLSQVLPSPNVNISFTDGRLNLTGVMSQVFSHPITGAGWVYGIKFHPGGARPFVPFDVRRLSDQSQPAVDVWPHAAGLRAAVDAAGPPVAADDVTRLIAAGDDFLRSFELTPDPVVDTVRELTHRLLTDPSVRRVTDVCDTGVEQRTLQRLFRSYVGVTPRWVLQRGRLHLAAERVTDHAETGAGPGWAELAVDLGYADQAHFIRDFRRVLGLTPAAYAAVLEEGRDPDLR
jgi:AraC-like DNA-binding protein